MKTSTIKRPNWITKVKTIQQANRAKVIRILGISEEQYWDKMLDAGTAYLTDILKVGDCLVDIMGADLYWKWWLNHWQKWDVVWLDEQKDESAWLREKLYDQLHDVSEYGFAPNKAILQDLFARKVLDKIIEEAENEAV